MCLVLSGFINVTKLTYRSTWSPYNASRCFAVKHSYQEGGHTVPKKNEFPDMGLETVLEICQDWLETEGLRTDITIKQHPTDPSRAYCEVRMYEPGMDSHTNSVVVRRGELHTRTNRKTMANIMFTISEAQRDYELTPWLWTEKKRRLAVLEKGPSGG